jgi:hypothetical protein
MKLASAPRWAISFADLSLVLIGCFAMQHAMRSPQAPPAKATEDTLLRASAEFVAEELFEPGEARLTAAGRSRLAALAATMDGHRIAVASRGMDGGGGRLDAFELAAARTAAVARELGADQRRLSTVVGSDGEAPPGQRISVRILD